jgi:uncharacterized membrane protein
LWRNQNEDKEHHMSKFVVIIFPSEKTAYEGTSALKQLHAEGTLSLYAMAVLAKEANGNIVTRQAVDEGPLGFAVGTLVGGLLGLLGGPIGGALGMSAGAFLGSISDAFDIGFRADFIEAASSRLAPGKAAVVAEIGEDWIAPLDMRMQTLGGEVVRQWRSDFEDAQIERLVRERQAELAELKREFDRAGAEAKTALKKRLDEARAKLDAAGKRVEVRQRQLDQEAEAKRMELEQQLAKASGETKAKIEKRLAAMKANYSRRSELLKQAWSLTKQALAA